MEAENSKTLFEYGVWQVDTARRELRSRGMRVPLGGRAFDIIEVLARSAGRLVSKQELMAAVWPDVDVEENTLQAQISTLRKALGADREILKTSSGRGYRLAGEWTRRTDNDASGLAARRPEAQHSKSSLSNLPVERLELVGRVADLEQLQALVSAHRVVTLTGLGGIGKTSLALEAARALLPAFDGGAWVVDIAVLSVPDLVPSTVARVLGLRLMGGEISQESLARSIGPNKLLLVLDSCEHLIDAVAGLVETLVRRCPNASVIATSREALRIAGEHVYRVAPLDVPPDQPTASDAVLGHSAVRLFLAKLQAANREFSPTPQSLRAIGAICRRLDGIPLAIEFAAARAALFGPELVLSRLDERFALLTGGHRTAALRHQTLRATLDWSYDLLSESEKRLLRRLSVFVGGFTIDAANTVMADTGATPSALADGLANLAAKSLVSLEGAAPGRWRLLETIRAYALEKLGESGETAAVARLHALYFRDLLAPHVAISLSLFTTEELARYRLEVDNVRAALDWAFSAGGDSRIGIALTAAYAPIWIHLALSLECRERTERALAHLTSDSEVSAPMLMQLNLEHGMALKFTMGSVERINAYLAKALEIAEQLDDVNGQSRVLWSVWAQHFLAGRCQDMQSSAARFYRVAARADDRAALLAADRQIGASLLMSGDLASAQARFLRVVDSYVTPKRHEHTFWGRLDQAVLAQAMLAIALCLRGLGDQAVVAARRSLEEARAQDSPNAQCEVLRLGVCPVAFMRSDLAGAEQGIAMYVETAARLNLVNYMAVGEALQGQLFILSREYMRGVSMLRTAVAALEPAEWTGAFPEYLAALALGLAGVRQPAEALATLERAFTWADRTGTRWYLAELHRIKGELLLQQGGPAAITAAERSFQQALEISRAQDALLWELRAALSLARCWEKVQRRDEARRVLEPVYTRLSEGHATEDARAARSLLESV